jgi:transcriptional regulator with XRE-family HTH domain
MVMDIAELGRRVRLHRHERGRTLASLAEAADISVPYMANIERGRGNPTMDVLQRIAEALDLPLAALVGDTAPEEGVAHGLATELPRSLLEFSKTSYFAETVRVLAEAQCVPEPDMRVRVLNGMVSAPRRAAGSPTKADWVRLLDTYRLILGG